MDAALPPSFVVHAAPGTEWADEAAVLVGGQPLRWIELAIDVRPVVAALLDGQPVGVAGPGAGAVARRLSMVGAVVVEPPAGGPEASSVAAVVPAHDAAATLPAALAGLAGVGEVVVVDDGSRDDTAAIARAHGARVIRHDVAVGPAGARNAGIRGTDADVVVLLDADATPEAGWLTPLLAHLADPSVPGVAPRVRTRGDRSVLGRYEAAASPLDRGPVGDLVRPDGRVTFVPTTALVLRRSAWERLRGFDEDLRFGEDLDLAWRLAAQGHPLAYEPAATVWHAHRERLADHLRNRFRYAGAGGALARRHGRFPRAAVASPSLAAAFGAGVLGARRLALVGGAAGMTQQVARLRTAGLPDPAALRHGAAGTVAQARALVAGIAQTWVPLALTAAALRPRARLPVMAAIASRSLLAHHRSGTDLGRGEWTVLHALDDLALAAGTLRGCVAAGSVGPLLPAEPTVGRVERSVLGVERLLR